MECYIAMARYKERCSDLNGIVREFFNATRGKTKFFCMSASRIAQTLAVLNDNN